MVKNLVIVHSSIPGAWKIFPEVVDRIKFFCAEHDSDMDVNAFEDYLKLSFISPMPTTLLIAAFNESGELCGHLVALAERWFNVPVVTVVQVKSDERLPKDKWDEAYDSLKLFATYHKAKFIQLAARNRAVARLFGMRGFTETRILMKQPVEGRAGKP